MIQHYLLTLALLGLASLLGATLYESVVMAPNYERDVPTSIDVARQFLKRTTPAHYFRVVSPLTQVVLLVSLIAYWGVPGGRWALAIAFGTSVLADVITYTFHYPRLAVMFKHPMPEDPMRLRRAAREWAAGNWVRGILLLVALLSVVEALVRVASRSVA
jgi:hypothetical protein